jgi:hypothetical protein
MENFTLTLTVEEINTILEALGNVAYKKSVKVIAKIHEQASEQQKAEEKSVKKVEGKLVD